MTYPETPRDVIAEARTALADYRRNEEEYGDLPESEQDGSNYEGYEDNILSNVHDLASCLDEVLRLLDPTLSSMLDDTPSPEGTDHE